MPILLKIQHDTQQNRMPCINKKQIKEKHQTTFGKTKEDANKNVSELNDQRDSIDIKWNRQTRVDTQSYLVHFDTHKWQTMLSLHNQTIPHTHQARTHTHTHIYIVTEMGHRHTHMHIYIERERRVRHGGLESMQYSRSWSCSMGGWAISAIAIGEGGGSPRTLPFHCLTHKESKTRKNDNAKEKKTGYLRRS